MTLPSQSAGHTPVGRSCACIFESRDVLDSREPKCLELCGYHAEKERQLTDCRAALEIMTKIRDGWYARATEAEALIELSRSRTDNALLTKNPAPDASAPAVANTSINVKLGSHD